MVHKIPVVLYGKTEVLAVEYEENKSPFISGFDALDVPFHKESCIGYPTLHAYFENMQLTGYKRYCGFIQLVERTEIVNEADRSNKYIFLDVPEDFQNAKKPIFFLWLSGFTI